MAGETVDSPARTGCDNGQSPHMPEICRFFGIIISLNYNDHPPPHFHVRYAEQRAIVAIDTLSVLEGNLSPRVLGLVVEWALAHRQELLEDWHLARDQQPLKRIAPLE
jgi:hypothetical protein